MAQKRFPDEEPIGQRLIPWFPDAPPLEIIGVVGKVKNEGIREEVRETILFPYTNAGPAHPWQRHMTLMVRSSSNPTALTTAVREAVLSVDRAIPITQVQTLEDVVAGTVAGPRFVTILLGIFATLALGLAAIGIYGVLSYSVNQRTQEIGIRMALGARPAQVRRIVVGQGLVLAAIGIAVGIGGAFGLTRLLDSMVFGVSVRDPFIFVVVPVTLGLVAALAGYLPARRATKVDPMEALRSE